MAFCHQPYPHGHPTAASTSTFYYCCHGCPSPNPSLYPPPPDPYLHSIPSHLHHPPPPQSQQHLHTPHLSPPCNPQCHPPQSYCQNRQYFQEMHICQPPEEQTHHTVSCLLRRIAVLEASLRHHSSSTSHSIRDAAARTIQTHFRALLVRRSRTLCQLKDLASIKSTLNVLKSSISGKTHFNSAVVCRKTMNLLRKLDLIRGDDPMIRDGKRSIRRELMLFIESIGGVSVERTQISSRKIVKNLGNKPNNTRSRVSYGDANANTFDCGNLRRNDRDEVDRMMEKLNTKLNVLLDKLNLPKDSDDDDDENEEVEASAVHSSGNRGNSQTRNVDMVTRNGGVRPKLKKSVSFAEDGNVYRAFRSIHESDSADGDAELLNNLSKEIKKIGVSSKQTEDDEEKLAENGDEDSEQSSEGEEDVTYSPGKGDDDSEDDSFEFSAPLPMKMEDRADFTGRKTVK